MTKLKSGKKWLRDFGSGTHEDPEKAHEFQPAEAKLLMTLHPSYTAVGDVGCIELTGPHEPPFKPGDDMVWVRHGDCWFAADRKALFLGTRKALKAHGVQQTMVA